MLCNETPAGGNPDIDLTYGNSGTSTEDAPPNTPVALLTASTDWVAPLTAGTLATGVGSGYAQSIIPVGSVANDKLLFLTSGSDGGGLYTAGKFIIKIWGAPVGYIG